MLSANNLRECGLNISRRLSWERTAQDFVEQMANTATGHELLKLNHLIVRLGIEGAIYYNREFSEAILYYDYRSCEDSYRELGIGDMQGFACAFVAALSSEILASDINPDILDPLPDKERRETEKDEKSMKEYMARRNAKREKINEVSGKGIRRGIRSSQRLFNEGFIERTSKDKAPANITDDEFIKTRPDYPLRKSLWIQMSTRILLRL